MNSKDYNDRYYQDRKDSISQRRKERYQNDPEYRERVRARAKEYKRNNPVSRATLVIPDAYSWSFPDAAEEIGVKSATLREWLIKEFFPKPKKYGPNYRFTNNQVELLRKIATYISEFGGRLGVMTTDFQTIKDVVFVNWNEE